MKKLLLAHTEAHMLRLESAVWVEVLQSVCNFVMTHNETGECDDFLLRADEAQVVLRTCGELANSVDEPLVNEAREQLTTALAALTGHDELVESLFFMKFSTRSIESLLREAKDIGAEDLDQDERTELRNRLKEVVDEFEAALKEMQDDLNDTDPPTER